jgi:acetolactate synthase-1/2/3 large subunit
VRLAADFGAWSQRVSSAADFRATLEAALAARGPALVELDMAAIGPPATPYTGPAGASAALLAGRGQAT